jgi:hypothetical protein
MRYLCTRKCTCSELINVSKADYGENKKDKTLNDYNNLSLGITRSHYPNSFYESVALPTELGWHPLCFRGLLKVFRLPRPVSGHVSNFGQDSPQHCALRQHSTKPKRPGPKSCINILCGNNSKAVTPNKEGLLAVGGYSQHQGIGSAIAPSHLRSKLTWTDPARLYLRTNRSRIRKRLWPPESHSKLRHLLNPLKFHDAEW